MRFSTSMRLFALLVGMALLLTGVCVLAQETTGGLQGSVKDASGAVVAGAHVQITGANLAGSKALDTDSSGYFRFANLPPGTYTLTASAKNFKTVKREGLAIETGRLPTVDVTLEVGTTAEVVEVTGAAPVIDVTTNTNQTNLSTDVLDNAPHGISFQSVIQFAPMARAEPLAGATGGTGGGLPGSSGNGMGSGFSIGGAADSESSYLVEGQDTENNSGGYSKANVPFDFIQEVQVKTSGIEAEHGGALGGVINVVMRKGTNAYHGSIFGSYETDGADANQTNAYLRYDPTVTPPPGVDPGAQLYQAKQDHFRIVQPGFTVGGPILKDRLQFFVGFEPLIQTRARNVNFGPDNGGTQYFTQDRQTYYATGRLDATVTQKIRLHGSWLNQYGRETGVNLPTNDPVTWQQNAGYINTATLNPLSLYAHGLGWSAPNATYNTGADISLTPNIVLTTRYGYFFENYHDFGWQTSTPNVVWATNSVGAFDNTGAPLPANLQQNGGTSTAAYTGNFTLHNANKHYQFNQDVAFFKGGWAGTHNIKAGYQYNRLTNLISQNGNVPEVFLYPGSTQSHGASTSTGTTACDGLTTEWGNCAGQYGYAVVQDFATVLPKIAADHNHALFVQDAWTVGHGLTFNLGVRVEKEALPVPPGLIANGVKPPSSINFSWSDKIEPRLGAAWGSRNGKIKIFGSYGVVNDVMKLLLAQTSWGAQAFEQCSYPLGPDGTPAGFNVSDIDAVFVNGRACPNGLPSTGANWAGGTTPAALVDAGTGTSIIENVNFRPWEPVAPGVKPYRQHEYVAGVDYQIAKNVAFEARYDRRRLDHVIEDASLADTFWFETYTVVNPGEGVNRTIDGYANYLTSLGQAFGVPGWAFNDVADYGPGAAFGTCPSCPAMPKAIRNYDGVELRVTKSTSHGWAGMFSYTYSRLWGNYTGLTTTDQVDGGGTGRNSPDTTRAFDEPFYYFGANGRSNAGLLPTDRPNVFKGDAYYRLPWKGSSQATTFGVFAYAYQGTPLPSYVDLGLASYGLPLESVRLFGFDQFANITGTTGNLTIGPPHVQRTPWYSQTDFNLSHEIKVNKNNEHQTLAFSVNATNLLNQKSVTDYYGGFNSIYYDNTPLQPQGINFGAGAQLYQVLEGGYTPQQWINGGTGSFGSAAAVTPSSWYGKPYRYQFGRSLRFGARFTF